MSYNDAFKLQMVKKMLPPANQSACALSEASGVPQSTLSRWLRQAASLGGMTSKAKQWTAAEKLRVVVAACGLDDAQLGELLRREGLHEATLKQWRADAEAALGDVPRQRNKQASEEKRRIKELERELLRKDKALAEVSALLVLKKKMDALLGGEDDDTEPRSGR